MHTYVGIDDRAQDFEDLDRLKRIGEAVNRVPLWATDRNSDSEKGRPAGMVVVPAGIEPATFRV